MSIKRKDYNQEQLLTESNKFGVNLTFDEEEYKECGSFEAWLAKYNINPNNLGELYERFDTILHEKNTDSTL